MSNPWPSTNTNPPACFYNVGGLAKFLNENPSYKSSFLSLLPNGGIITSSLSSIGYDPTKVPLCTDVTIMSFNQAQKYNSQLNIFKKVYTYNSNAYFTSQLTLGTPVYYNFRDYNELMEYRASVGLVNKLYNFNLMAELWTFPFPIYM